LNLWRVANSGTSKVFKRGTDSGRNLLSLSTEDGNGSGGGVQSGFV